MGFLGAVPFVGDALDVVVVNMVVVGGGGAAVLD